MGVEGLEPPALSYLIYSQVASQLAITPIVEDVAGLPLQSRTRQILLPSQAALQRPIPCLNPGKKNTPVASKRRGYLGKDLFWSANIIPRRLPETERAFWLIFAAEIHGANAQKWLRLTKCKLVLLYRGDGQLYPYSARIKRICSLTSD